MASSISDLTRRKALAWTAFWKLEKIWRSSTISIATKVKLFNVTCVTVFLYGCDSWILSTSMESKINAFATSCYRIMLNIKRVDRVTNAKVYQMSGTQPLITTVRQCQLRFHGHILRRPEDEPFYPILWQKETWEAGDKLHFLHPKWQIRTEFWSLKQLPP